MALLRFDPAVLQHPGSVLDLELGQWHAREGASLSANDIGRVEIETQQPLAGDPYHRSKTVALLR